MTGDDFPKTWGGILIELSKIVGAVSTLGAAAMLIWAWTAGPVALFFDRIDMLVEDVAQLKEDVARANGEDRVIRQPSSLSYIREPVRQGDAVVMIMVAGRTALGQDCRLTDWVPIFTDEFNIPTPGQRAAAGPVRRQIGGDLQTLRIEMTPPPNLRPGRITVYLTLTYSCPGSGGSIAIPDRTDVLAYELLPRTSDDE